MTMASLQIVADENIPLLQELFGSLGEIRALPGRSIGPADVADADILLVRSVTRVDASLLGGSPVRFVGTCTIGTDHLDVAWLQSSGIAVHAAPGCNALAVAQYVAGAMAELHVENPAGKVMGVVGLGNVGRQVAAIASEMGFKVLGNDPLVEHSGWQQAPLEELAGAADVVCLHTPLTTTGPFPTYHLLSAAMIDQLKPFAILLNAGRGAVLDNHALADVTFRPDLRVVLDVWEGEPRPMPALLQRVDLASPHVAGYSLEGRWRGSQQIRQALLDYLGVDDDGRHFSRHATATVSPTITVNGKGVSPWSVVREVLRQSIPLRRDTERMRQLPAGEEGKAVFDSLRKSYPLRREFSACPVRIKGSNPEAVAWLGRLGFPVQNV